MKVRYIIEFTEQMLGTKPSDEQTFTNYVASLKEGEPPKDEIEAAKKEAAEAELRGTTIFQKDDKGNPIVWDYQIKGFMKDACSCLTRCEDTESKKVKAFKKVIDGCIFVEPRQIEVEIPKGKTTGFLERPLRAQTAQGERVALARSETVPVGSRLEFTVLLLNKDFLKVLNEWMDYGVLRGLGGWRNSGCGRFRVVSRKEEEAEAKAE